jgi:uncharacterized protein
MPLWSAFVLGLLGSLHCAGMCGPLVFALHKGSSGYGKIAYHTGRILTYAMLGLVLGVVGLAAQLAGLQKLFSVLLGIALLASVVIPLISSRFHSHYLSTKTSRQLSGSVRKWMGKAMASNGPFRQLWLGGLNGLLPCGMVYIAIAGSLSMADYFQSSLYMIFFGMGTWPMLLAISYGSTFANHLSWLNIRRLAPVFIACLGLLLIWRGLNLHIEYIPGAPGSSPFAGITICTTP